MAQTQADIQNPKIVPPSPDAAALGKYGQIPVDKSTGIPSISIPLYEIKTPRFSLPISLSYHASGIKVEEVSSWVGAGWSLNAGGLISRSIVGLADDCVFGFLTNTIKRASQIVWPTDMFYLADALNNRLDSDPDNFFYNFNNHSGGFVFGVDKLPVLIPYKPLKINFNLSTETFNVTDEEGNTYTFNSNEYVTSSISTYMGGVSSWYLTQMVSSDLSDTIKFVYSTDATTQTEYTYNFSQSINDRGTGTVSLLPMIKNPSWRQFNALRISSIVFKGGKVDFVGKGGRLDEGVTSLDSVIVSNFNPATNQYGRLKSFKLLTDYFYSTYSVPSNFFVTISEADKHRLKLTGLVENDGGNTAVKTHQFDYNPVMLPQVHCFAQDHWGYFNGQVGNLTLLEPRPVVIYPSTTYYPFVYTIGWNGQTNEGGDRSVSPTNMQAGVLTKITYPTKGYTVFSYDCNKQEGVDLTTGNFSSAAIGLHVEHDTTIYTPTSGMLSSGGNIFRVQLRKGDGTSVPLPLVKIIRISDGFVMYSRTADPTVGLDTILAVQLDAVPYQLITIAQGGTSPTSSNPPFAMISTSCQVPSGASVINVGGLRIKSIQNFNGDSTVANTESYYYGNNNESGGGVQLSVLPSYHSSHAVQNDRSYIEGNDGLTITLILAEGMDTYTNNSVYPMASFNGSSVAYPTVKVYHGDSIQNTGKSVFQYATYPDSFFVVFSAFWDGIKPTPVTWKNGDPLWEGHYRNNGTNLFSLVKEVTNIYDIISRTPAIGTTTIYTQEPIGFSFVDPHQDPGDHKIYTSSGHVSGEIPIMWPPDAISSFDYPITTGSRVLRQSVAIEYGADGSSLTDTTKYYYDNLAHVFPTRIVSATSTGDAIIKTISYPQDMVAAGLDPTGIYAQMTSRNIISPDIQTTETRNGTLPLYKKTNNYFLTSASNVALQSVAMQTASNPIETRLTYNAYDKYNNVLSVSKANDVPNCYIWGYQSALPIAQVVNADTSSIAYSSFEEDGTGKWNPYTGTITTVSSAPFPPTGNRYYNLTTSATLNKSGLVSGNTYIISYWSANGVYTITGGTAAGTTVTGKTIGSWTYYEHKILASSSTLTITGTGSIDEVRLYPAAAQMTTYTYAPLVGMTSQCDLDNRISYYYYDGLERLRYIKDQDGNILKTMEYHYQGP